jgi:hypothetical protein
LLVGRTQTVFSPLAPCATGGSVVVLNLLIRNRSANALADAQCAVRRFSEATQLTVVSGRLRVCHVQMATVFLIGDSDDGAD